MNGDADSTEPYPYLSELYRLPYTVTDNPNTVIEPSTHCNLDCPGCYRIAYLAGRAHRVMSPYEMQRYINAVLQKRTTSCLTFMGGEPLLYPHLDEAIAFAVRQGLHVGIYTNGMLLDRDRLSEFARLGVSSIAIHVDKHQGRGGSEAAVAEIRDGFCEMFRSFPQVVLGFSFMFRTADVADIPEMVACFSRNSDVVKFINYSLCANVEADDGIISTNRLEYVRRLSAELKNTSGEQRAAALETFEKTERRKVAAELEMCRAIHQAYGFRFCSYLGSRHDPTVPGKINALCAFAEGQYVGCLDANVVKAMTEQEHRDSGRYPYSEGLRYRLRFPPESIADSTCLSEIYGRNGERAADTIDWQHITLSFSPSMTVRGMNICDSCTDALLHEGRFVPMCTLDMQIAFGKELDLYGDRLQCAPDARGLPTNNSD